MDYGFLKDKRILVTGGTGLIGYNLVHELLSQPVSKVFVTGRTLQKLQSTFESVRADERLILVQHNAADPIPDVVSGLDLVFHAAGPMERNIVQNYPVDVILPNILGTIHLLELLKKEKKESGKQGRMVIFSSVTVYNNISDADRSVGEEETNHAISLDAPSACYSESKRMSEVIARSYARQYGLDVVMARFSTVYGYTHNIPDTAFFEFVRKAVAGETIVLNGTGLPRRDNIFIGDAISGLLTLAGKGTSGEAYNVSSGGDLDNFAAVDEIAEVIARETASILNRPAVEVRTGGNAPRRAGLILDNAKLKALGWKPLVSMPEGINDTVRKYLEAKK